jgi:peptidoglycan glycosyltransferase
VGRNRELGWLLALMLAGFCIVAVAASYWAVYERESLLARADNPRLLEARGATMRGAIYDRDGELLAVSEPTETRFMIRRYLHEETYSALGYYSLRYGTAGIEALYDPLLSGDDQEHTLTDILLQQTPEGANLQITLDLQVQRALAQAMRSRSGAAVVLSIPDGNILGLLSLPTYNPNSLDQDWEALREAPDKPFFNRALQGQYQPGGAMQTPLLAVLLLNGAQVDTPFADATVPISIGRLDIACAVRLAQETLALRDAYAFACPAPFVESIESRETELTAQASAMLARLSPLALNSLIPAVPAASTSVPEQTPTTETNLIETALGQGRQTISPISMAMLAAAIANDGNTPQPQLLLATQTADDTWRRYVANSPSIPVMTEITARRLQDLMRYTVASGAALNAGRPGLDVGGHAALAYTGDTTLAWFIGFSTLGGRRAVAVAVVVEDSEDPGLVADIGGAALQAAQAAIQDEIGLPTFPHAGS